MLEMGIVSFFEVSWCRSVVYLDGSQIVIWDGVHWANGRMCTTIPLSRGSHRIYIIGFEYIDDSQLEVTYSGPDTHGVRTHIGGRPFFPACDPHHMAIPANSFTLCTYKSEPTSALVGDCTPTVGIAHPRWPGPCSEAMRTTQSTWEYYSGGDLTPVLGSANDKWVFVLILVFWSKGKSDIYPFLQSDVHYVGQTVLSSIVVGPPNGQGLLKLLVPGSPDCRMPPVGDGLIGVEGQNCPFQMYTISGVLVITQAGPYTLCTSSADG